MEMVSSLLSCITGEIYYFLAFIYNLFPCLGEIYFSELLGRKILREAKMSDINLKKNGSFLLYSKILGLASHVTFGRSSVY